VRATPEKQPASENGVFRVLDAHLPQECQEAIRRRGRQVVKFDVNQEKDDSIWMKSRVDSVSIAKNPYPVQEQGYAISTLSSRTDIALPRLPAARCAARLRSTSSPDCQAHTVTLPPKISQKGGSSHAAPGSSESHEGGKTACRICSQFARKEPSVDVQRQRFNNVKADNRARQCQDLARHP